MHAYLNLVATLAPTGYEPRHLLAYILTGHPTLGHLSREDFRAECLLAARCVDAAGPAQAERCARSWGL